MSKFKITKKTSPEKTFGELADKLTYEEGCLIYKVMYFNSAMKMAYEAGDDLRDVMTPLGKSVGKCKKADLEELSRLHKKAVDAWNRAEAQLEVKS
jgi:hypothetical protein